jgi:hypothetical protein
MYLMGTKALIGKVYIYTQKPSKATEADLKFRDVPLQPELGFLRHASSSKADRSHVLVLVFVKVTCELIYTRYEGHNSSLSLIHICRIS